MVIPYLLVEFAAVMLANALATAWLRRRPTRVVFVRRIYWGARGLALPGVVFMVERSERVLRHELAHQDQLRRWTPLGTAVLLGSHYAWLAVRHVATTRRWPSFMELYNQHPLEDEARRHESETGPLPPVVGWDAEQPGGSG